MRFMGNNLKKKLGKKGFVMDLLYWVPKLIYFNVVLIIVMLLLITFIRIQVDLDDAQAQIYINRVLYSMDSISYYDKELGRLYPGVIDIEKFNDEQLTNSLYFKNPDEQENTYLAMNLSLRYDDTGDIEIAYYNEQWYERFLPRVDKKGRGGAKAWEEKRFVLVKDKDKTLDELRPATLTIKLIVPNG